MSEKREMVTTNGRRKAKGKKIHFEARKRRSPFFFAASEEPPVLVGDEVEATTTGSEGRACELWGTSRRAFLSVTAGCHSVFSTAASDTSVVITMLSASSAAFSDAAGFFFSWPRAAKAFVDIIN